MAKRVQAPSNSYFTSEKPNLRFVSTGCTVLDCALGGGWALGRVANVVGDKSTAKTALATETIINFLRQYPEGVAAYRDTEAAFDQLYAQAMGMPIEKVDFGDPDKPLATVEDFARDLEAFLEAHKDKVGIYCIDSLDALSDEAEMKRDIGDGTFGANKAKQLSALFRTLTRKVEGSKILLLIVSQVRDNIGAIFGEKHKRSGGKALDFYASQVLWLAHMKTLKRSIKKIERPYGIAVRAKVKKNKIGLPFREADFEFHFGFGIEDVLASITWLNAVSTTIEVRPGELENLTDEGYQKLRANLAQDVRHRWAEVETSFLPTRRKYG